MTEPQESDLWSARKLVETLGGHPLEGLGIDLEAGDGALWRWLLASCLLSARRNRGRAPEAYRALETAGCVDLDAVVGAAPGKLAGHLERAGMKDAAPLAARILRAASSLGTDFDGSLTSLEAGCDGLEEVGGRIARLAPGIGAGTVSRFLRPLRARWAAAREIPLAPAGRAAAIHLGWLPGGEQEEGEPGALERAIAAQPDAPALHDVEAALGRLGAAACARDRPERCPLGDRCPRRGR